MTHVLHATGGGAAQACSTLSCAWRLVITVNGSSAGRLAPGAEPNNRACGKAMPVTAVLNARRVRIARKASVTPMFQRSKHRALEQVLGNWE